METILRPHRATHRSAKSRHQWRRINYHAPSCSWYSKLHPRTITAGTANDCNHVYVRERERERERRSNIMLDGSIICRTPYISNECSCGCRRTGQFTDANRMLKSDGHPHSLPWQLFFKQVHDIYKRLIDRDRIIRQLNFDRKLTPA